jgi:hypothetical protein
VTAAAVLARPYEPFLASSSEVRELAQHFRAHGYATLGPPALSPDLHAALLDEAVRERRASAWKLHGEAGKAGVLPQDNVRAQLGTLARELAAAGATRALLAAVTDHTLTPGWSATCLTFYERAGQYIGAHRDKDDVCQYALLLYMDAHWPQGRVAGAGLQLHVRDHDDARVAARITAWPNRVVILHGARLTHFRPPLEAGESIVMLNACYAVVD